MAVALCPKSRRSHRLALSALILAATTGLVAACTADGAGDGVDQTPVEPEPTGAILPGPPDADNAVDSSTQPGKDAGKDAKPEAAVDAGPPPPVPGTACTVDSEVRERACGACGKQKTVCLDEGTGKKWTEYGACENELVGGCVPGTTEDQACGNCGTRKRTCSAFCAWTTAACTGEPVGGCTAGSEDYTTAGCAAGVVRQRSCNNTCGWGSYAACAPLHFELTVSGTAGEMVSGIYPLRATQVGKRLTGACPNGTLSTTTNHPYVYVELKNPTGSTLTLSAWNTQASTTSPIIDTLMGWYPGNTVPTDDASRKACSKGMIDSCPTGLPCGDTKWAGLTTTNAVSIPPGGSALLYFASYPAVTGAAEGNVKLVLRTDSVN